MKKPSDGPRQGVKPATTLKRAVATPRAAEGRADARHLLKRATSGDPLGATASHALNRASLSASIDEKFGPMTVMKSRGRGPFGAGFKSLKAQPTATDALRKAKAKAK